MKREKIQKGSGGTAKALNDDINVAIKKLNPKRK